MGIPLNVKKNFKVILKIIILNYYLICNHLRIFACQERVKSFCPSNTLRSLLFRWSSAVILKECINSYYFNYLQVRRVAPPDSRHRERQSQPQD